MEMGALSLCFPEGDGGTEGVRWLGVVVGGSFVSLDFFFVSRTPSFSLFCSRLLSACFFLDARDGEEYTIILRSWEVKNTRRFWGLKRKHTVKSLQAKGPV